MNEMLDEQSRSSLVRYRIERADETIAEAKLLASEGYYNTTMNRLYSPAFMRHRHFWLQTVSQQHHMQV